MSRAVTMPISYPIDKMAEIFGCSVSQLQIALDDAKNHPLIQHRYSVGSIGELIIRGDKVTWIDSSSSAASNPGPIRVLGSLVSSIGKIVLGIASGGPLWASTEDQEKRLATCKACPELKENDVCAKCLCLTRQKIKFQAVKCPLGKW